VDYKINRAAQRLKGKEINRINARIQGVKDEI